MNNFDLGLRASAMAKRHPAERIREMIRRCQARRNELCRRRAPRWALAREEDLLAVRMAALRLAEHRGNPPLDTGE